MNNDTLLTKGDFDLLFRLKDFLASPSGMTLQSLACKNYYPGMNYCPISPGNCAGCVIYKELESQSAVDPRGVSMKACPIYTPHHYEPQASLVLAFVEVAAMAEETLKTGNCADESVEDLQRILRGD